MHIKNKIPAALVLLSLLISLSFIPDNPLEKLLKQLEIYTASYPQEKVHVQTDKPYYAIGEEIWLKAYVVTADGNMPTQVSKVLYVDLADEKNVVRKSITLPIVDGVANGNIALVDSLTAGNYRLRAYTNYMRNYDDGFFFEKQLTIGSIFDVKVVEKKAPKELDFELQFFPEGGTMVDGLRSKVGIKAVAEDGLGRNLSGYIVNSKREKVALFATEHAGMGAFAFTPAPGERYNAVVVAEDGKTKSFALPDAAETGYVFSVNQVNDNVKVGIGSSAGLINGSNVNVVAQANGKVYASFTAKVDKAVLAASIPKKKFPTGIVQFTLFTADNKPIAERLVFINQKDELNIDIKELTPNAGIKKKTQLVINVKDVAGKDVAGNFSIAVTDMGKAPYEEDDETTILSNLLLTSDLRGYIEQPNYYFNNLTEDKARQLDQLLLTQGWTRFNWEDVLTAKDLNLIYRAEQSPEITGKITTLGKKPLANAKIMLVSATKGFQLFLDTLSDAKGNFVFDRLALPDSVSLLIQAKGVKDAKTINITLDKKPGIALKKIMGKSIDLSSYTELTKEQFKDLEKFHLLPKGVTLIKTVEIKGYKPNPLGEFVNVKNSSNLSGAVDILVTKEKLALETNLTGALYKALITHNNRGKTDLTKMLIILDGLELPESFNKDFLNSLNPTDIEGVEILVALHHGAVYGERGLNGVMHITSKRGQDAIPPPSTNIAKAKNKGFTPVKEFYVPDYDNRNINKGLQDLRTTIFWKPNVITDEKGNATLSYFNAGTPGTYKVTLEGMDAFGNIGRKVFTYEVKQSL